MFLRSLTTEAMGTGGLRAYSLSHSDKVNAGAKAAVGVLPNPALQYVLRYLLALNPLALSSIKSNISESNPIGILSNPATILFSLLIFMNGE